MRLLKFIAFTFLIFIGYNKNLSAQYGAMPPFSIQIEPITGINVPGLHSFAFARSGDKWLFIGGRTNGLHGLNSSGAFGSEYMNTSVIVIDTTTWTSYSASLNQLPLAIGDPMRSNNMEYIQDGNYLYMVGGYGYDSVADLNVTFPTLTAVHVDNMINAVINGLPIASTIRQISDTNLRVCGGDLGKIGSSYYLMFGHNFEGRYANPPVPIFTQVYSDRIKKFNITDDGTTITLSAFTYQTDTTNFHRRDLNVVPIVEPSGALSLEAYGGVFQKDSNLPYREPIKITAAGATVNSAYKQVMSQYTCATLPIYDSATQVMYTTFFGGISLFDFNHTTNLVRYDSLVPFIDDITTQTTYPSGVVEETVLPLTLPGLLGANTKFISNLDLSHYTNEVINIRNLPNTTQFAGYLFGGIRAQLGNFGSSTSNDTIYRVYITPNNNTGIEELNSIQNIQLFPNPTNQSSSLLFNLKNAERVRVSLVDVTGKNVLQIADEEMQKGNQKINITTSGLGAGIYICKIQSTSGERMMKLVVER